MKLYLNGELDLNISYEENICNLSKKEEAIKESESNTKIEELKRAKLDALIKKAKASKNMDNKKTIS